MIEIKIQLCEEFVLIGSFLEMNSLQKHNGKVGMMNVLMGIVMLVNSYFFHSLLFRIGGFDIFFVLLGIVAIIRGVICYFFGGKEQRLMYKDSEVRMRFEEELESSNVLDFSGIIMLNSWMIIKDVFSVQILKYENVTNYYNRGRRSSIAIEVNNKWYDISYSNKKDGDAENIVNILDDKLKLNGIVINHGEWR